MAEIRKAAASVIPLLVQLRQQAVVLMHRILTRGDFNRIRSWLQSHWPDGLEQNVCVTACHAPCGFTGYQISGKELKIEALFVDPAFFQAGRREKVLNDIIHPDRKVLVDVNVQNPQATEFQPWFYHNRPFSDGGGRSCPLCTGDGAKRPVLHSSHFSLFRDESAPRR